MVDVSKEAIEARRIENEKNQANEKYAWIGCLIPIVIIIFFLSKCESSPKKVVACDDTGLAFVMSQTFVERQLKSPSTASFPSIIADGVSVSGKLVGDKCVYNVQIYVDAQNSFGAVARNKFLVELSAKQGQTHNWKLEGIY